jgi:ATPase subunit of ABC transporter with duplicated ATPase domains
MSSIACSNLGFVWPDGTVVLDGLDLTLGPGRTGLIGVNGSGKSTLLDLIAGRLQPTRGAVQVDGDVAYLPQHIALRARRPVDDVLGIAGKRAALRAVEAGTVTSANLETIGDDWDIEERARATLDRLGLRYVGLDRTVGMLSGGESVLLGLAALFLRRPDVLLLDEPTNNLDLDARQRLYAAVADYRGVLVVVSHDRALLDALDRIVELRDGAVRVYGGNLTAYEQAVSREQDAAERRVRTAAANVRRERRELIEAHIKLDRRVRTGRKAQAENRLPKIVAQARKRRAQVSAGKLRDVHVDRVVTSEAELAQAAEAVRDDDEIRVDLPETEVPSRRTVLECVALNISQSGGRRLWDRDIDLAIRGPQRIALLGPNGAGKTALLRLIAGQIAPSTGTVRVGVDGVRYLPQRLDLLDDRRTVLDNVALFAPSASGNELRARLARFHLRGDRVTLPAGVLSGGERFRVLLAALLSAHPAPQLLMLDEPTNNLDMASIKQLEQALAGYRGALIVVSHDLMFLRALGITRWLHLERSVPGRGAAARQVIAGFAPIAKDGSRAGLEEWLEETRPPGRRRVRGGSVPAARPR